MKNLRFMFLVSTLLSVILFANCGKYLEDENPKDENTSLEFTVVNDLGNTINGASVKLYGSSDDWLKQTNQIGSTKYSDENGKVKFDDLQSMKYYWFAENSCYNNYNGAVTTKEPISKGKNNLVNVVLTPTGKLLLTSNSSNPYKIFINDEEKFTMNGGTTKTLNYLPTGSYSIRVLQVSGYVLYPTEKTYTGILTCGLTLTVDFPN